MIKILPLENQEMETEPHFSLTVTLGYGEHCTDAYTESFLVIDDEKAIKYACLTEKDMDEMDWLEIRDLDGHITQFEAEKMVRFFDSLWKRKNKDGYEIRHIIISDGASEFWWKKRGQMTDKEFKWFSEVYEEYRCSLFNPQIEHNWCGIVDVKIEYIDEKGKVHKCEVI